MNPINSLEALEQRIAPAGVSSPVGYTGGVEKSGSGSVFFEGSTVAWPEPFGDPKLASSNELRFRDADGDNVTVRFSRAFLAEASIFEIFSFEESGLGHRLVSMDLTKYSGYTELLKGLDITVTAERYVPQFASIDIDPVTQEYIIINGPTGDNSTTVGSILAPGVDLGHVSVEGQLGKIVAGDSKLGTVGLESLTVENLGDPDGAAGDVTSIITGALGKLEVKHDLIAAVLRIQGGKNGDLLNGHIGGDVTGGEFKYSGSILAEGTIKSLAIGGDIVGGSGERSGFIQAGGGIKSLDIAGGILGGSEYGAGRIEAKGIGTVKVAEGLHSGTDEYTGSIYSTKNIKSLEVGGLDGGAYRGSGSVFTDKSIGKVVVAGDLAGGAGEASGYIQAQKRIGQLSIDGDLFGSGGLRSGSIASFDGKIGKVSHDGNTVSGMGNDSGEILNFVNKGVKKGGGSEGSYGASITLGSSGSGMPVDLPGVPVLPIVGVPNSITFATGDFFASKIQEVLNGMAMGLVTSASNGSLNIFVYGQNGFLSLDELVADYKFTWREGFSVVDRAGGGITISYVPVSSNG